MADAKVGGKVTVHYKMYAVSVEDKSAPAKKGDAKKTDAKKKQ